MKTIHQWFEAYGESHRNTTNKAIHWICIPVIYFSILCLLSIPQWTVYSDEKETLKISPATIAVVFVLLFYIRLSKPLALGMGIFSVICMFLAHQLANLETPLWLIATSLFVMAWLGQFYGHHIEGKKPSFLNDLQFLLIGPAWLMGFVYRKLGIGY